MKMFKRILAAALVLSGAVLLVIISLYLLVDDATLFGQMVSQLETFTDIRVLDRGDARITRTIRPTLTVNDLVITNADGRYRVETASLQVQVNLTGLLLGQLDMPHVFIGPTRVEIREDESPPRPAAPPKPKFSPKRLSLPLTPVLHDVRVSTVEIIRKEGSLLLPDMRASEFTLELKPDKTMSSSCQVEIAHQNVGVKIVLKDEDEYFGGHPLTFSVGMHSKVLNLSLEGHVDFTQSDPIVEAAVHGWTPDAEKIAPSFQQVEIPGNLTLEGQLKGTFARLSMEHITATYHGPGPSHVELKGSVADVNNLEGAQLTLKGKLDEPAWLTPVLPESLGAVKNASLSAQIFGGYSGFSVKNFDFKGKTDQDLDLSLYGQFDLARSSAGLEPANIQAELEFSAPNTRAARFLIFETIPEFGAIKGRCDILSAVDDLSLMNIVVETRDKSAIQANLSGGIARFPLADSLSWSYNMDVSIQAAEGAVLAKRVGLDLPEFGPLDLNFRIEGSAPAVNLNQIKLSGGRKDGIRIGARGEVSLGDRGQTDRFETVDLKLQAQSPTTRLLSAWIGRELPELGPLSGEARLHKASGIYRIDPLKIQTTGTGPLTAAVSGSAGQITLIPALRIQGIQLDAVARTDDAGQLNTVFGLKDGIPSIGPLTAKARISGDDQHVVIDDVSMAAGQEGVLLVNLNGSLGHLSAADKWQPQNASLTVRASSSSSRALAEKLGYRLPELGPLNARANIRGEKKFIMESAHLRIGDKDNPVVKATGSIDDLFAMKGVKGDGHLHLDGRRFAAFADFYKLPQLSTLTGQVKVSDRDGTLGIDSFHVESARPELLSLKANGSFDNFRDPSTLLVNSSLTARDLQVLGAIFDRQWPAIGPVKLDSDVRKSGEYKIFSCSLAAGETGVEAKLKALFDTTPMRISGKVIARKMLFWELLEKARKEEKKKYSKTEPVFSREPIDLDWLKKVDLDVVIEVESFAQEEFIADSAWFQVKVKSGLLSISPARFVYPRGKLDMDLKLDGRKHPRLTFSAFGRHLDPRRALDIQGYKEKLEAEMNIDVSFSTFGLTPHELAANSQGGIYITMQNGKIAAPLIDLIFWDIAGWAWRKATNERYYHIDCGVADYSIDKGVISTKAFILDFENITISGGGTIDLGNENVKYVFLPKKKSLIIKKANPVDIEGPLNDPRVKAISWKSAAIAAGKVGGIIAAPYIFIPLAAADYLAGQMTIRDGKSACLEYQKTRKVKNKE